MFILEIRRDNLFSPKRGGVDKAILDSVHKCLYSHGHRIFSMAEAEFARDGAGDPRMFDAVYHMCRSDKALQRLEEYSALGIRVINSAESVQACRRTASALRLIEAGVPFAYSVATDKKTIPDGWTDYPCWIKKGDSHAIYADDVCYAATKADAERILERIDDSDGGNIIFQKHIPGQIVKFYGVGDRMFRFVLLASASEGKFGLEKYNECGMKELPQADLLNKVATEAARVLGVQAYGGDAIASADGSITLIDLNDWPSFAFCKDDAAAAIASIIESYE